MQISQRMQTLYITENREFKAGTLCTKYAYQNIRFELKKNILKITNLFDFTNLNEYFVDIDINVDGNLISSERLILDIKPKKSEKFELELPESCEMGAYLVCRLIDKNERELGLTEFELMTPVIKEDEASDQVSIEDDGQYFVVKSDNSVYKISKHLLLQQVLSQ